MPTYDSPTDVIRELNAMGYSPSKTAPAVRLTPNNEGRGGTLLPEIMLGDSWILCLESGVLCGAGEVKEHVAELLTLGALVEDLDHFFPWGLPYNPWAKGMEA